MNMHMRKRFAPPQEVVHLLAQTYPFDPYAKNDPTRVLLSCILSARTKDENNLPHSWQTLFLLPHNTKPMSGAFDWSWKHTKNPLGSTGRKPNTSEMQLVTLKSGVFQKPQRS